jgi:hypothetical protein
MRLTAFDQRRLGALLSSERFGSSVERDGGGHPLCKSYESGRWWRRGVALLEVRRGVLVRGRVGKQSRDARYVPGAGSHGVHSRCAGMAASGVADQGATREWPTWTGQGIPG